MGFPKNRMRRLRSSDAMRRLVRETSLSVDDLVYPLFVREGEGLKEPIKSMAGCFHFSPDTVADEAAEVASLRIPAVLLFGLPGKKDDIGSEAWSETGVVQRAIREIKKAAPQLLVITDVCLCAYTEHGHCGVIKKRLTAEVAEYAELAEYAEVFDMVIPDFAGVHILFFLLLYFLCALGVLRGKKYANESKRV